MVGLWEGRVSGPIVNNVIRYALPVGNTDHVTLGLWEGRVSGSIVNNVSRYALPGISLIVIILCDYDYSGISLVLGRRLTELIKGHCSAVDEVCALLCTTLVFAVLELCKQSETAKSVLR